MNISDFVINIGGEIRTSSMNNPQKIYIDDPSKNSQYIEEIFLLNKSIAIDLLSKNISSMYWLFLEGSSMYIFWGLFMLLVLISPPILITKSDIFMLFK